MNKNIDLGLQGSFKVDIYKGKELVSTTDYFSNFITPTGLTYPLNYSFADCFRYLSVGRSSIAHSGSTSLNSFGTTGLYNPISSYVTSVGNQNGQWIDWQGYASGETNSNCGTTLSESGPRFYRAWTVPTGGDEIVINEAGGGLMISEFMVSPSSGQDPIGASAFSRVIRDIFIPNGYRSIISYQLRINIQNTGITYFSGGAFQTGNAETSNDLELIRAWSNLSGYYKQVYHGLRCIDNLGFTYITKLGDGMEPSSQNTRKMVWYLSPDNSQFDVNSLNGGPQTSVTKAYQSDGLMSHIKTLNLSNVIANPTFESLDHDSLTVLYNSNSPTILDTVPSETTLTNIRIGSDNAPLSLPQIDNYKVIDDNNTDFTYQLKQESSDIAARTISYATPGKDGWNDNYSDFGKKAAFSSNTLKLPFSTGGQNAITGRKKTIARKSIFSPTSSLGYQTRFGSMTYAYQAQSSSEGNSIYYPMVDTLFFDSSGQSMMPHYRFISGIQLTERGTGILDATIYLSGDTAGNIFRFSSRRTFQGPGTSTNHYLSYAPIPSDIDGTPLVTLFSGFMATGSLDSTNIQGQTGGLTINGIFYSGGYGAVYGVLANNNFYNYNYDLGVIPHTVNNLILPANTGQLYWPVIREQSKIRLYVTGVNFWAPELNNNVIIDNSGWYNKTQQIIKDVNFELQDSSFGILPPKTYVKNVTGTYSTGTANLTSGYYITKTRYYNNQITLSDIINNASYTFTGYVVPNDRNTNGQFKAGVWSGTIPTDNLFFTPTVSQTLFSGLTAAARISGLLTGIKDRGYTNGTGGTPIKPNDNLLMFFSGFSGSSPLYLTMISGSGTSAMGFSYLSGVVSTTNFCSPTGTAYHGENSGDYGYRLKPTYDVPNYYGTNLYSPTIGGQYPALSLDNGLEIYLNLSWSSACGNSVTLSTCNEPI